MSTLKKHFTHHLKPLALCLVLSLSCHSVFGWGNGHDYVNRYALQIMPEEIKKFLGKENQDKMIRWSHAPDCFAPLSKEKLKYPLTDSEIKYLESFGGKNLYCLHSTRKPGQAANFILLVKAFIDKNPARSAFWMATLLHTVADDVACNHTSHIHYLTYGLKIYKIKITDGIGVDFANIAKTQEGKKAITALLAKYKPSTLGDDPKMVLDKILYENILASTYGTRRENKIVATYGAEISPVTRSEGIHTMAELGVYGIIKSMDIINTAWEFSKKGTVPVLNPEAFKKAEKARSDYLAKRPLKDDSIYAGLLNGGEGETRDKVGIVLERSRLMMNHKLSFGGRLIMAAVMRTLKSHTIPYSVIDLKKLDVAESAPLSPKKTPVLMICSGPFHVSKNVKRQLRKYVSDGGRVLWVGGRDGGFLGKLSATLKKADPSILPVTKKYGQNNLEVLDKIRITFLPPFSSVLGEREYKFINNPDTKAGSQKPWCLLKIDPVEKKIKPLAKLSVGEKNILVAAAQMNSDGSAKSIFLPEYLLAPFLLDNKNGKLVDVAKIKLDGVGTKILISSLKMLFPKKEKLSTRKVR